MKDRIELVLGHLLARFFCSLPFEWSSAIGAGLGRLFCRLDKRHRLLAFNNLRHAFPEKNDFELNLIVRGVYEHLGRSGIEFLMVPKLSRQDLELKVEVEGLEHYERALKAGKGAILLGAHFGAWEWMPIVLGARGFPMHMIVRPVNNPLLNAVIDQWRTRFGNIVLNKRTETGAIISLLREGKGIGFLLDQDIGRKKAVFVNFFGRLAGTNKALATIAMRTGAPVIPMFIVRQKGPGGILHKLIIEKPMILPHRGVIKADQFETTQLFTKKIEDYVRQYPDQWLWLHRRWKTRPESEDPLLSTEGSESV